jgi:IclR family KDG regulon transcriptional repressor
MMETPDTDVESSQYRIDSVDTAIALLILLASHPNIGLSEIARRAGHSKARVFRLIKTLEARGMLIQSSTDRTYRLGYAALILGGAAARQTDLVQVGGPILASLGQAIGETAQLRIIHGNESMCIACWEPARELKVNALVGRRRPLYRGTNRVLLAFSPPEFQAAILDALGSEAQIPSHRPPVQVAELRQQLEAIRAAGYLVSHSDMMEELSGVGCPIFGPDRRLVGAINISAPSNRLRHNLDNAIAAVMSAGKQFSLLLGAHDV